MQQKSELQTNDQIQGQVEYPHNLLRNIAKESALTEYVLGKFYQNVSVWSKLSKEWTRHICPGFSPESIPGHP